MWGLIAHSGRVLFDTRRNKLGVTGLALGVLGPPLLGDPPFLSYPAPYTGEANSYGKGTAWEAGMWSNVYTLGVRGDLNTSMSAKASRKPTWAGPSPCALRLIACKSDWRAIAGVISLPSKRAPRPFTADANDEAAMRELGVAEAPDGVIKPGLIMIGLLSEGSRADDEAELPAGGRLPAEI